MKKKLVLGLIIFVATLLFTTPLYAAPGAETGHFSWDGFYWDQTYSGWGPANYYGQNVRVVYTATNTLTWVEKETSVRETLVQNGTATVYDISGNIIDERPFHCLEVFEDEGKDLAIKQGDWWNAGYSWWDSRLESYHYLWKIQGVYTYEVRSSSGEYEITVKP